MTRILHELQMMPLERDVEKFLLPKGTLFRSVLVNLEQTTQLKTPVISIFIETDDHVLEQLNVRETEDDENEYEEVSLKVFVSSYVLGTADQYVGCCMVAGIPMHVYREYHS